VVTRGPWAPEQLSSLDMTRSELRALKAEVRNLDSRLQLLESQLESQLSRDRRSILLGQLAGTIDEAAGAYVYGDSNGYFRTLGQLKNAYESGVLKEAESERWQEFCSYLMGMGWAMGRLINETKPLRKLCMGVAHASASEKAQVTAGDLLEWAAEKFGPLSVTHVAELVEVVSAFTKPGQPLVCVDDVRGTISAQLRQQGEQQQGGQ